MSFSQSTTFWAKKNYVFFLVFFNPLGYWFWGFAQAQVHKQKPKTIEEVQMIVKKVARTCKTEMIQQAAMNIVKRAKKCIENDGSHFESSL